MCIVSYLDPSRIVDPDEHKNSVAPNAVHSYDPSGIIADAWAERAVRCASSAHVLPTPADRDANNYRAALNADDASTASSPSPRAAHDDVHTAHVVRGSDNFAAPNAHAAFANSDGSACAAFDDVHTPHVVRGSDKCAAHNSDDQLPAARVSA